MSDVQNPPRWMGVGRSAEQDSRTAAANAARDAIVGTDTKLVLVFAAITHDPAAVQEGIREVAGDVPVLGCTTHGEIGPGGPQDGSVTVTAIGGTGFTVTSAVAQQVSGRQREAGVEVARAVNRAERRPYRALLMLTDGMIRDQESILRGCYSVLGASVPLFGGAAVLARDVAKQIEEELTYPGQIRVTVVRESRVTEIAR